jgi:hypothetical protein
VNCAPGSTDAGIVLLDDAAPTAVGSIRTVAMNSTNNTGIVLFLFISFPPIKNWEEVLHFL